MYPCGAEGLQTPGLGTYYALTSLLVIVLAVSLLWIPFVQLITEINTIIARIVIYFNTQLLGYSNSQLTEILETILVSQKSLLTISFLCVAYTLYLASSDLLLNAACYFSTWPNVKYIKNIKKLALGVIENLLNLKERKEYPFITNSQRRNNKYEALLNEKLEIK